MKFLHWSTTCAIQIVKLKYSVYLETTMCKKIASLPGWNTGSLQIVTQHFAAFFRNKKQQLLAIERYIANRVCRSAKKHNTHGPTTPPKTPIKPSARWRDQHGVYYAIPSFVSQGTDHQMFCFYKNATRILDLPTSWAVKNVCDTQTLIVKSAS